MNKEKYTKLSVVLFPVVLKVANFLLPYFSQLFPCCLENLLSGYSLPIMQGPSARNSVEVVFVVFCFVITFAIVPEVSITLVMHLMSCDFWGML